MADIVSHLQNKFPERYQHSYVAKKKKNKIRTFSKRYFMNANAVFLVVVAQSVLCDLMFPVLLLLSLCAHGNVLARYSIGIHCTSTAKKKKTNTN